MKKHIFLFSTALLMGATNLAVAQSNSYGYSSEPPDSVVEMEAYLPFCDAKQKITVAVYDGMAVLDGDMLLGNIEALRKQQPQPASEKGLICDACAVWQNATIPYRIEPGQFTPGYEAQIHDAAEYISSTTNLCLQQHTNETDYVSIVASDGCWSFVGRIGGPQQLGLDDITDGSGCPFGTIVHEFTHAAGHFHEQSRPDRDQHVFIFWGNIDPAFAGNFNLISDGLEHGTYDFFSVMHYGPYAFSTNQQPTISRRSDCSTNLGGGDQFTSGDIDAINFRYPLSCECSGGGCMSQAGQADRTAVGNFSRFVSQEMHGNYKLAEATYIKHKAEIDRLLDSSEPSLAGVQAAWAQFRKANTGTFLKAFLTKEKNQVSPEAVDALGRLLTELSKAASSKELKADLEKYRQLLGVTIGKELKDALIAFDRAKPAAERASGTGKGTGVASFSLHNNPVAAGGAASLLSSLPKDGYLTVQLLDLWARPVRFLLEGEQVKAGTANYLIDTGDLPPGVYLVKVGYSVNANGKAQELRVLRLVVQ